MEKTNFHDKKMQDIIKFKVRRRSTQEDHQTVSMPEVVSKAKKPGYTNPAFRAMGIPPLKLPSRNWTIFWSVLTVAVSGIVYDKQKQKQIRTHYQEIVKPLASEKLEINKKPRKITVFIAPPPSDYLDTSLKVWKRYIKPILYYAGLDYEIVEEEKQGVIRTEVANRMREVRRQLQEKNSERSNIKKKGKQPVTDETTEVDTIELSRKFKADFDYRNVMGIFYNKPKPTVVCEDSLNPDPSLSGGVICLGRGAYKEYITGLHEGLLGPLDPPEVVSAKPAADKNEEDGESREIIEVNTSKLADEKGTEVREEEAGESGEENKENSKDGKDSGVLKSFIRPDEYADAKFPEELHFGQMDVFIRDPNSRSPILLHQAVLMIPIPNLIGFLNIPERIYRFYQKRYYAESVCSAVTDLVEQKSIRDFEGPQDLALGEEEEEDWPKSWVKEGLKRKSEWTTELNYDPRITRYIRLYNKDKKGSDEE